MVVKGQALKIIPLHSQKDCRKSDKTVEQTYY